MPVPATEPSAPRVRWTATVTYRTDAGPLDVDHVLTELSDLHDLVERGPHWDTILGIAIQRTNPIEPGVTVEQAEAL